MFFHAPCVLSVDPSLGKVDKASLSQQTVMELLIQGFTSNTERFGKEIGVAKDIAEWNYLKFNDAKEITEIQWGFLFMAGTIELQWLPMSCTHVTLSENMLTGTADLIRLPHVLEMLSLSMNRFSGQVDLTKLPSSLISLFLYENKFSGITDFSQLPKSLARLDISDTLLEGNVYEFEGRLNLRNTGVSDMRINHVDGPW